MGRLRPVAFDLETTGLDPDARITVAGLAADAADWLVLNTGGRPAPADLEAALDTRTDRAVELAVRDDEAGLLDALAGAADRLDPDRHYLCAYNGETYRNGYDLPLLRTACARHDVHWPFVGLAYVDVMTAVERFDTGDAADLAGVHDRLVDRDHADPFDDSAAAVDAHAAGDWPALLCHNLADVRRTRELAALADRYVAKTDLRMKQLTPPDG